MTALEVLPLAGFVQGLFLSLILLTLKGGLRTANAVLALLILAITVTIGNPLTESIDRILVFAMLLFGPLFLLYTLLLTKPGFHFTPAFLGHFGPFFIVMPLIILQSTTGGSFMSRNFEALLYYFKNLHTLGYSIAILIYLNRYRRSLKQQYSNIEKLSLSWISMILALFIFYFGLVSPIVLFLVLTGFEWIIEFEDTWTPVLVSAYIFALGFNGIRNHQVFVQSPLSDSGSRETFTEENVKRLNRIMNERRPYLSQDLTLDGLAELTHIPSHVLSRIINTRFEMNFFDYINSRRIAFFNVLYASPDHDYRTILELAMDSGFSTKSTFNLSYKKLMGMTPTQYRRSLITPPVN